MGFLKKFIFGFAALFFIFLGGAGTQSDSMLLQGGGFVGLIIGLIVLYIFAKMAWRAMGCLPSLLIVLAVVLFILYAIGAFSDGIGGVGENVRTFLGEGVQTSQDVAAQADIENKEVQHEDKQTKEVINLVGEDQHPILTENIKESLLPKKKAKKTGFNPMNYPAITGVTRVVSGDTLVLAGRVVKMFGIAAPDVSQTCADGAGRGYKCGRQSIAWLNNWLADNEVSCHIINESEKGLLTGVCMLGPYDIGAALVNAGWAVADTRQSKIYEPYQNQALMNKRGLWQGEFYMPWDWQKIQNRKANVKIIKKEKSSRRKVWSNPFGG